jgi:hypothetical protein
VELQKKFPTTTASLLTEVDELYERDLKYLWVERIVNPLPGEEFFVVKMHPYR